ncbi:MAG: 3'(2'),5'-bisphosphate nucleotidase CysQ [Bacteroidales bacterium]|nr:3'(2'),5'-bisphosphate nucleotidase CysQ [Bacteroidales bacterium]
MNLHELLFNSIYAALSAGEKIIEVYNSSDFEIQMKSDRSPLTLADIRAHQIIKEILKKTRLPLLSEEGADIPYDERKLWETFWIVDPVDGTKEFIKRNDEFTVNIALLMNRKPKLGVIYAPVLKELYFTDPVSGAYKIGNIDLKGLEDLKDIQAIINNAVTLPVDKPKDNYCVAVSRSHLSFFTKRFIKKLKREHPRLEIISAGSSLKLCMIAEGVADIYPRFGPTMEWDIAAGHALILATGGSIKEMKTNIEMEYNKPELLNPWFVAIK